MKRWLFAAPLPLAFLLMTADAEPPVMATGMTPNTATVGTGATFRFTLLNTDPYSPSVVSRNTGVVSVTLVDGDSAVVTGVAPGTAYVVATVSNGNCIVVDSALVTVFTPLVGDTMRGRLAWESDCEACHMTRQPTDLELFNFPDSTVIRRALAHVDTTSALDIVSFIDVVGSGGPLTRTTVIYQPGDSIVANDSLFAAQFPAIGATDEWPSTWTRDTILAHDIREIRIPLQFPVWSNESSLYDWVPGDQFTEPIPAGVLAKASVASALATYRASPSFTTAGSLRQAVESASTDLSIPDAPCVYLEASNGNATAQAQYDPQGCGDLMKWSGGLCYLEGVRSGMHSDTISRRCEGGWWEVGHRFHKAQQMAGKSWCLVKCDIEMRDEQITFWIYIGSLHTAAAGGGTGHEEAFLYFAGPAGFGANGGGLHYGRWVSWFGTRMLVRRGATPKGTNESCRDIWSMADFGHSAWDEDVAIWMFKEILWRMDNGYHIFSSATRNTCTAGSASTTGSVGVAGYLGAAMTLIQNRSGMTVFNNIKPWADSVRTRINNGS